VLTEDRDAHAISVSRRGITTTVPSGECSRASRVRLAAKLFALTGVAVHSAAVSTSGPLTLLLGGARSGKSAMAVELGRRHHGGVTFIATSPRTDDDLAGRIARHRAERPRWPTIEEPLDLCGALTAAADDMAIVDCLTLWVNNLVHRGDTDDSIEGLAADTACVAADRRAPTIVVSNEVGLGIHPLTELGRRYRDLLGRVNQRWAAVADRALLLVAGRALALADPWTLL
jgi:adenosylcobinamide kinase / adenosylcobinamide-phosphate guanylyltransferase